MYKRLVRVGNSRALTIERSVRAMMGIEDDTVLRVTMDGHRIVIEPVAGSGGAGSKGVQPTVPVDPDFELRRNAAATLQRLIESGLAVHGLFDGFHHEYKRVFAHLGFLVHFAGDTTDPLELAAMRRNAHCLAQIEAGRTLAEAMVEALRLEPLPVPPAVDEARSA